MSHQVPGGPGEQVEFGPQQGPWPAEGFGPQGQPGYGGPQGPGGPYGPYQQEPPRMRPGLKAVVITAVLTVLVGGGAFAFVKADPMHLLSAGPQAAEAIPADAFFYLGVDLDPSAEQKIAALRFLNRFPAFKKEFDLSERDDVREVLFKEIVSEFDCASLDYGSDIAPWIGAKLGVAGLNSGSDEPTPIIAVESNDEAAAKKGLVQLADCSGDVAWASTGDYVLLSDTQAHADGAVKAVERGSLADSENFKADMSALGDTGVATIWVEGAGLADVLGTMTMADQFSLGDLSKQRFAGTFRFNSDSAELAAVSFANPLAQGPTDNPVVKLPDSTAVAFSLTDGDELVKKTWERLESQAGADGVDFQQGLSELERETGLRVPDDLEVLFGSKFVLAIDSDNLDEAVTNEDPSLLKVGFVSFTDVAVFNAVWDRVNDPLERRFGPNPAVKHEFDGGVAVGLDEEYAQSLAKLDGDLGETDKFRSVVENGAESPWVVYVDFDALEPLNQDDDGFEDLQPLRAAGISAYPEGDYTRLSAKLSLN